LPKNRVFGRVSENQKPSSSQLLLQTSPKSRVSLAVDRGDETKIFGQRTRWFTVLQECNHSSTTA